MTLTDRERQELRDAYEEQRDNALRAWNIVLQLSIVLGYKLDAAQARHEIAALEATLRAD